MYAQLLLFEEKFCNLIEFTQMMKNRNTFVQGPGKSSGNTKIYNMYTVVCRYELVY